MVTAISEATDTSVTVGNTSTTVLAADNNRRAIYISRSATAVMNKGIRLSANGGAYEINATNLYTGIITGICASGSKNLCISYK
jgi:hypothetical protein